MSATSYDKPTLFNDKGKPVVVSGWSTKYYCNVQDGRGVRCGPKDGPQCTSCVRLQVRMPPPYPQTKERIVPFWLKILEDWKKTGGRPCNEDGTPIFQQETKVSGLFMEHKIGLIKDLENLPESVIADRWAWTKTEKAWMVDIIRGLKIASSPTASPDKSSGSMPPASANESAELAVLRLELEDAKRKHKEDLQREQALRRTLEQEVARLKQLATAKADEKWKSECRTKWRGVFKNVARRLHPDKQSFWDSKACNETFQLLSGMNDFVEGKDKQKSEADIAREEAETVERESKRRREAYTREEV